MADSLLQRVAAGEGGAFDECLNAYAGLVWSMARRALRSREEAEDAVQDVFLELWRSAGRFDPLVAGETAFVAMITRRRLIDRLRRGQSRHAENLADADADGSGKMIGNDNPAVRVEQADEVARAEAALDRLRPEERDVLRLTLQDGLSFPEAATRTGWALGTVKTHARRGLIRVRDFLNVRPSPAAGGVRPAEASGRRTDTGRAP